MLRGPSPFWGLQIRRPYFHAKPLEKSQLKNWREYLDFETANGTHERVLILYERCLVACALYEEFWIRVREESCCPPKPLGAPLKMNQNWT